MRNKIPSGAEQTLSGETAGLCLPCEDHCSTPALLRQGLQLGTRAVTGLNFASSCWGRGGWFIITNSSLVIFLSYYTTHIFSFLNRIFNTGVFRYIDCNTESLRLQQYYSTFWGDLAFAKELLIMHSVGRNKLSSKLPRKVFSLFFFSSLLFALVSWARDVFDIRSLLWRGFFIGD